jgi:MFS family permease
MGVIQGVVICTVAQFLRHPRVEPIATSHPTQGTAPQLGKRQYTTLEMLRTPQFYVMYSAMVLMSVGGLLVTANAGRCPSRGGCRRAALTLAATLSPIANGGSRIFWGWVSDRMGRENTMVVAFLLQALCLYLVVSVGPALDRLVRHHAGAHLFHVGRDLLALSGDVGGLLRHSPRHLELRRAVHGQGHGRDHGWLGRRTAVRVCPAVGRPGFYGSAVMALVGAGLAFGLKTARHATLARETPLGRAVLAK